ncbi:MAG: HypC/HybG/HupF family hydrogenase formation chaperone [Candidatus Diapherotrites archaeon]
MCIACPGRVVSVSKDGTKAIVDYGNEKREVNNSMAKAKVGNWVLVQYGMIVLKLSKKEVEAMKGSLR